MARNCLGLSAEGDLGCAVCICGVRCIRALPRGPIAVAVGAEVGQGAGLTRVGAATGGGRRCQGDTRLLVLLLLHTHPPAHPPCRVPWQQLASPPIISHLPMYPYPPTPLPQIIVEKTAFVLPKWWLQ